MRYVSTSITLNKTQAKKEEKNPDPKRLLQQANKEPEDQPNPEMRL